MKVFGNFGGMHSGNELSFGGTCSDSGLELGLVCNGNTGKTEYNASEGVSCVSVSGVSCINEANKLQKGVLREIWEQWSNVGCLIAIAGSKSTGALCQYMIPQSLVPCKYLRTFFRAR